MAARARWRIVEPIQGSWGLGGVKTQGGASLYPGLWDATRFGVGGKKLVEKKLVVGSWQLVENKALTLALSQWARGIDSW